MRIARTLVASSIAAAALSASTLALPPAASASAATQPSWCGWKPANNSHIYPAWVVQGPLNVRTGQSTSCNSYGTSPAGSLFSPNLILRCQAKNAGGETWYYADTDISTPDGGRGWVLSAIKFFPSDP